MWLWSSGGKGGKEEAGQEVIALDVFQTGRLGESTPGGGVGGMLEWMDLGVGMPQQTQREGEGEGKKGGRG